MAQKHKSRQGRRTGPKRDRYWGSERLKQRKVRNMVRRNGLTQLAAERLWESTRKRKRGAKRA